MRINGELIASYMEENEIGKCEFAKKCNVTVPTLNKALTGACARISTLNKIATTMNVRLLFFSRLPSRLKGAPR